MKKIVMIIMTLALLLGSSPTAFAQGKPVDILQKQQLGNAQEQSSVLQAINDNQSEIKQCFIKHREPFMLLKATEDNVTFGTPYKVYVPGNGFLDALRDNKPIAGLLQNAVYFWEVPVLYNDKAVDCFTVQFIENKWQIATMGSDLTPDAIETSSNPQDIAKIVSDNSINTMFAFIHFRIAPFFSDYILIADDNDEYLYSLNSRVSYGNILIPTMLYNRQHVAGKISSVLEQMVIDVESTQ